MHARSRPMFYWAESVVGRFSYEKCGRRCILVARVGACVSLTEMCLVGFTRTQPCLDPKSFWILIV
jgi:hypothetical protein